LSPLNSLLPLPSSSSHPLPTCSSSASKYDAAKEAKEMKEAKQKQLKHIEEARKKAAEPKGLS